MLTVTETKVERLVGADMLIARARELVPTLVANAEKTERNRQVDEKIVLRLRELQFYRVLQPTKYGGFEHDFETHFRLAVELGRGCGSTAWVYSVTSLHQWVVAAFPVTAQDEVWKDGRDAVISGSYTPSGTADLTRGGYQVSGTWSYASGCDHADWHLVQAILPPGNGGDQPFPAFLLVPRSDFHIDDNWYSVGLSGTGSKNVVLNDIFVPSHRVVALSELISGRAAGTAIYPNPLYRLPFPTVVPMSLVAPVIGVTRGALESFVEEAKQGRTAGGGTTGGRQRVADNVLVQTRVGETSGYLDAAHLLVLESIMRTQSLNRAAQLTKEIRVENRRDYALATQLCKHAVDTLLACTGASGFFLQNRVQRAWRDVNCAARHVGLSFDTYGSAFGRFLMGLEATAQY